MKKITYLDSLMKNSRFPEFRSKREFTKLIYGAFLPEVAAKCLEIKRKYYLFGQSLTPEKAVDICFGENIWVDTDPQNRTHKGQECWFGKDPESGNYIIWIDPALSIEDGQNFLFTGLSTCLLYSDVYKNTPHFKNLDELTGQPELLKAVLAADCLRSMLLANETEAELTALQSIKPENTSEKVAVKTFSEAEEITGMAVHLSLLLKNPLLPKRLYDVITDEINDIFFEPADLTKRKNIESNLKSLLEKERKRPEPEKMSFNFGTTKPKRKLKAVA